jgi:two-component system invasion response regulator UvrY
MIRLFIADDHPALRLGLRQIISAEADMECAGEAESHDAVLAAVTLHSCDVLILDIVMPGGIWLEVLHVLRREHPQLRILILSVHPENQLGVQALKAGASGYLTKESAPAELVLAIRRVVRGGRYISSTLAERVIFPSSPHSADCAHNRLSQREYLIMTLLTSGKTVGQIADDLSLSVKTVSTYRSRVLDKLGLRTTAGLIRYALEHNLVQ